MRNILLWNTAIVLAHKVFWALASGNSLDLERPTIIISLVAAIVAAGFGTPAAFGVAIASIYPIFRQNILFAVAMGGTFSQVTGAFMPLFLLLVASILFAAREAKKAGAKEPKFALMIAALPGGVGLVLGWPLHLLFLFLKRSKKAD